MARFPSNPQPVLRPQDLVVLLRLALPFELAPSYATLGAELGITASEAHAAVDRAVVARLAIKTSDGKPQVIRTALRLFLSSDTRFWSSGDTKTGPPEGGLMAACRLRLDLRFIGGCHVVVVGGGV